MKIGIDTFTAGGVSSGAGAYLREILKAWPATENRWTLFGWEYDKFEYVEAAQNLGYADFVPRCRFQGKTASQIWHFLKYPDFAKILSFDLCFFPAAHRELPRVSPCPTVGTVHDMAAYWGTRATREHLGLIRMALPNAMRRLDRVIAVSEWVKKELIEIARVKPSRIDVVYNGVNHADFYPRTFTSETVSINPVSFRRPYILYTSRLDNPVKNHINLFKAFTIFKDKTRYPHRLVLAGANAHGADKIKEAAAVSKYRSDIFFTGLFPAESLPLLTAAADMVVYPSKYEGFGRGIVEAMASGVPVTCARAASLPEIAGDAALFFSPDECEDMAQNMITLSDSQDVRRRLIAAGLERAKLFSWDAAATQTLKILMETAGKI